MRITITATGNVFAALWLAYEEECRLYRKGPTIKGLSEYDMDIRPLPGRYWIFLRIKSDAKRKGGYTSFVVDRKTLKILKVGVSHG